jgi:hypothetical protein
MFVAGSYSSALESTALVTDRRDRHVAKERLAIAKATQGKKERLDWEKK